MRRFYLVLLLTFFVPAGVCSAQDFLGAPVLPGGSVVSKTPERLEMTYHTTLDKALAFYQNALENEQDIKFRDRRGQTYIEDQGARPWHSIHLIKNEPGKITIVTLKDNWTWILGTLILRFVGVFMVLLTLYLAMAVSGRVLSKFGAKAEQPKVPQKPSAVAQ